MGKKKTQDVQFYTEVMEVNQAIDAGRRSMYDPDELEEEQRERDTRNRVSILVCLVARRGTKKGRRTSMACAASTC